MALSRNDLQLRHRAAPAWTEATHPHRFTDNPRPGGAVPLPGFLGGLDQAMNRLLHRDAARLASALADELAQACERIEVAGSIRRRTPTSTDVELVAIPRIERRPKIGQSALFTDEREDVSVLWEALDELRRFGRVRPITPGRPPDEEGRYPDDAKWAEKRVAGSRYFRLWLPRPQVKVDLFMTTADRWGATLLVRTGSDLFNLALVDGCKAAGARFSDGGLYVDGRPVATPEERDVFAACGFAYVEPERRVDGAALVSI